MKFIHLAAAALVLTSAAASAQDSPYGSFSGSVTATTDYVFRGFSQSDEHPAFQPGLNWDSGMGVHVNLWASNVDFNDGGEADAELDITLGYGGSVGDVSYDFGAIYYAYPGAAGALNYDYWEAYTTMSVDTGVMTLSGAVYYSPDFFGGIDDAVALQAGASKEIAENLTFSTTFGTQMIKKAFGSDYLYWSAGLTYSFPWFDANISYHDTDVSVCGGQCEARGVLTISKSF